MNEKKLNMLIAVAGNEESVLDPIKTAFEQCDIQIGRIALRVGKNMIMQYLSSYPDTDVVVLSQYQGTALIRVEDVDNISTMLPDVQVIVIVAESKSSTYMKELESCGIYTAVYDDDADYRYIAELILNGRSKKDARQYYGVTERDVKKDSGFEIENAVVYLSSYDQTIEDLTARMAILSKQLSSPSIMLDILAWLPPDVFRMVSRIERYTDLCRLVEERRFKAELEKNAAENKKVEKKPRHRSRIEKNEWEKDAKTPEQKITRAELISLEGRRETADAGFIAMNVGVGCTTCAILFSHAIANSKKDYRVAIVEFDNADSNFETLCKLVTGERNTSGLTNFSVNGVDYYFNTPYSKFVAQYKPIYDLVVYDFGCCQNDTVETYFLRLQTKFVVSSAKEWHYGELVDFITEVSPMDVTDSFIYLFSCVDKKLDMGAVAELLNEESNFAAIPYEANPFQPSKPLSRLFVQMYSGTWKQRNYGKVHIGEKLQKRIGMEKWKAISLVLSGFVIVNVVTIISFYSVQTGKYRALQEQASSYISSMEEKYIAEERKREGLESELSKLDRRIYILNEDIPAGTIITADMIIEQIIKTSLDDSVFFRESDLGEMAVIVSLDAGTPLFNNMVAEQTEIIETIPDGLLEDMLAEGGG